MKQTINKYHFSYSSISTLVLQVNYVFHEISPSLPHSPTGLFHAVTDFWQISRCATLHFPFMRSILQCFASTICLNFFCGTSFTTNVCRYFSTLVHNNHSRFITARNNLSWLVIGPPVDSDSVFEVFYRVHELHLSRN